MNFFVRTLALGSVLLWSLALLSPAFASDAERGQQLVTSRGCTGCHAIDGKGGKLGPALDGVGKRLDDDKIMQKLVDPKAGNPKSVMPSYKGMSKEDLEAMVDYLEKL